MSDVLRSTTFQLEFKGQDGITGIKQFTRAVSDADKTVEELSATLGDNVEVTYKNVQSKQELTAEARALVSQMERTNARVKEMTSLYQHQASMIGKTAQEQEVLNAVYKLGANATQAQKNQISTLVQQQQALRASTDQTGGSMRNLRGMSQQVGWQLQDVAVQAQAGTSAFVILSQQGSQLAAAFGPTGALVGAAIAVAGALAGAGFAASGASEDFKALESAAKSLMGLRFNALVDLQDIARKTADPAVIAQYKKLGSEIVDMSADMEYQHIVTERLAKQRQELADKVFDPGLFDGSRAENQAKLDAATREYNEAIAVEAVLTGKVNALKDEQDKLLDDEKQKKDDAEKATKKAAKAAETAANKNIAAQKAIAKARESAFRAEYLSLTKATETIEQEYERRKDTLNDYVKHEGTDQRTDQAYAALEQWKTNALTEEYKKREAVRKQIEEAQRKQGGREDPTGFENDLFARNLKTLSDQKKLIGESELTERQRIDGLIEAETERHVSRLGEITNTQLTSQLQNYATFTGALGNVFGQLQQFAEEGSKEAAALFYINQAIALAETIVNTELAATKAMGQLGVFGIPASTLIRATGYASAGIIAGQTIAGAYDKGGNIPSGQLGIVSEYGDELVNGVLVEGPARVTSREETAAMMNNGGGSVSILIENRIDGASYREERIDENTVKIIAEKVFNQNIDSGVSSVLGNRNSKSTKQLKSNFSVKGKY